MVLGVECMVNTVKRASTMWHDENSERSVKYKGIASCTSVTVKSWRTNAS